MDFLVTHCQAVDFFLQAVHPQPVLPAVLGHLFLQFLDLGTWVSKDGGQNMTTFQHKIHAFRAFFGASFSTSLQKSADKVFSKNLHPQKKM